MSSLLKWLSRKFITAMELEKTISRQRVFTPPHFFLIVPGPSRGEKWVL
jgi:hypothetical protein